MKVCIFYLISSFSVVLSAFSPNLLVAHSHDILWVDVGTNTSFSLISADSPILAFDIHQAWRQVFWTAGQSIYRTPLYDESATTVMVTTGEVGGLAVDWVHNILFWVDLSGPGPWSRIEAVHLDGRGRRVVLEADWPITALALDPQIGKLFWIESSSVGREVKRIKSSNYYGSHTTTIYKNETIQERSPLAADVVKKTLHFFRRNSTCSEKVEMNYNISDPVSSILMQDTSTVQSLGLNDGGFFYSDGNGLGGAIFPKTTITLVFDHTKIRAIDTDTTPQFKLLNPNLKNPTQLRVLGLYAQPFWREANTTIVGCEQEAVPGACVCHYGFSLSQDGRACTEDGYILYTTATTFGRIRLDGEQHSILYNDTSANIQAFDLHVWSGEVYWSDHFSEAIYRAPAEAPHRKQVIVANTTAYGVVVDWLHGHLYWSDHSRILVANLDGTHRAVVLEDLEAPAGMAIDPVNRYIFWAECGHSLTLRRAGLDGSNVTSLVDSVTCGAILTTDPDTSTFYWLDWTGSVHSSKYDGSALTLVYRDLVHTMTILDNHILWTPLDIAEIRTTPSNSSMFHTRFHFDSFNVRPNALKVMKTSEQPLGFDVCAQANCSGLCLPRETVFSSEVLCLPTEDNNGATRFSRSDGTHKPYIDDVEAATGRSGYLELVNSNPFSLTLRCSGSLLTHPVIMPFIEVTEVDSLVPRVNVSKLHRTVQVSDKSRPFTVDSLNPSTTYSVSVRNRVTRASSALVVHTPPPPLAIKRLPVVTVPGIAAPIKWLGQDIHFSSPNVWEDLVHTDLLLLLVSKNNYSLSHSPPVPQPIMDMIKDQVKDNFVVLQYYKTKEEFDEDPCMYLGNLPWGVEFWLAMVQVTEYRQTFHVDVVYSKKFGLPDPYWTAFMEQIFDDQD